MPLTPLRAVVISLCLLCSACATSSTLQDGKPVPTPPQWGDFCTRHPGDPAC